MDYKKEAEKIVEMFMPYVYCYMGSGMLSNDYDAKVARTNAIQCAIKHVEGIMEETDSLVTMDKYTKILNQLKQML